MRILVADKLADEGLEYLKQSGVAFDEKVGLEGGRTGGRRAANTTR